MAILGYGFKKNYQALEVISLSITTHQERKAPIKDLKRMQLQVIGQLWSSRIQPRGMNDEKKPQTTMQHLKTSSKTQI